MLFYRIDATLMNFNMSDDKNKADIAGEIQSNCNMFYHKCKHSFYFYVSSIQDNKIIVGCIAKTKVMFSNALDAFWNINKLLAENVKCEEISLHATGSLLHRAWRNDFITSDDDILKLFQLDEILQTHLIEFGEYFSEEHTLKSSLKKRATELLCEDTLVPELDRIYAGAQKEFTLGNPVHYLIQTDSKIIREKIIEVLMSALYANNRLQSRRYCAVSYRDGECVPDEYLDKLYGSCNGGAMVATYSVGDAVESEFANASMEIVSKLCGLIKKHKNEVLTVLCLPRSCEKVKSAFYEQLGNITIVELTEETVFGEKAKKHLCQMAKNHGVTADDNLLLLVDGNEKGYLASDLSRHFDRWFNGYLKSEVFPQYASFVAAGDSILNERPKGDAYTQLQNMIGLTEAKKVIMQALDYHKAQRMFKEYGMKTDKNAMHMVFMGNPGTAKTTVARLFAQIMKDNGLLSKGDLYEVGRSDLVGKYVGWTAKIVKEKFRDAKGSVLFIDEAYSLLDDRGGMYGDEAINTIVQEMENNREDIVVIFAGYPKEMEQFLERNPGLRSRIAFHVPFEDYSANELYDIAKLIASQKGVVLSENTKDTLIPAFERVVGEPDFGNGRYVRNLIERAKMKQASRLVQMNPQQVTRETITLLESQDFEFPSKTKTQKRSIGFSV